MTSQTEMRSWLSPVNGPRSQSWQRSRMVARPIANMIAFVAKVRVGPVEAHLACEKRLSARLTIGLASGKREGTRIMSTDTAAMTAGPAVRPFRIDIAEEAIVDLRRRIAA